MYTLIHTTDINFYTNLVFQNGVDYCFDTVVVTVSVSETVTGNGGGASGESGDDGETHVLVPILSETGVSVVLESHLEEDTHYTATLSFNSHLISTFTFCEYTVWPVTVDVDIHLAKCHLVQHQSVSHYRITTF